ncbi:PIG-L family deacetylase [Pelagicoccus sp. SDUM812005]|uniref:PIG-L deacetylase family protein n=1 Tax=Pelagicoccus sp. SDUM812005 TaxID=3041257 RepID=UPI00280DA769|nr:PIG-L family deacetylase [Pelagicoccus sp. SDUM812005]MDQ8183194.1 PIG-L family deacetylase [Pelagicoccus sp. SDUM812005]
MSKETTILAVGAHPDDIEFGCGAILLKEAEAGSRIHFLVCSKGESGSNGTPEERVAESEAAAARCGASLSFLDCGGDGRIVASPRNAMEVARVIRATGASVLLAPSRVENQHPDHVAIGKVAMDAARLARYAGVSDLAELKPHAIESLYFYAITPGAEPAAQLPFVFDVSLQIEAWRELMSCHQSQMKTRRYLDLQVSRARTLGLQAGCEYAQALWPNDPVLVNGLNSAPRGIRLF